MTHQTPFSNPVRVMVAEDDPDMSHVLEFLLSREGFSVRLAKDGRDALRAIAVEDPFDLVILDVMMPFASGIQVVRALRQQAGWRDVPVMMVSGKGSESDIVAAIEAGASDYLTKPFRPRELVARVRAQITRG
ncbi:MAG: response regulator [Acidobacteria bacterium]|nr:response regulator [Acidobacteriota bacterium]